MDHLADCARERRKGRYVGREKQLDDANVRIYFEKTHFENSFH